MALSKFYTKKKVRQIIELWMQQLNQELLNPDLVNDFIDMAVIEVFEDLDGGALEDYGRTVVISNQANNVKTGLLPKCEYINSTRKVTALTAHGLTSSSIGNRVAIFEVADDGSNAFNILISTIESITNTLTFVVKDALGLDLPSSTTFVSYAVFSKFGDVSFNLSGIKWKMIRKISDSINGEVIRIKDSRTWENLADYPQYEKRVCWMQHGEDLFFFKGSQVSSYGILTAYIWGYPEISTDETDYLDIKDNFLPLVISKAQNLVLSHIRAQAKGTVDQATDTKALRVADKILKEKEIVSK